MLSIKGRKQRLADGVDRLDFAGAGACIENLVLQEASSVATQTISDLCSGISSLVERKCRKVSCREVSP